MSGNTAASSSRASLLSGAPNTPRSEAGSVRPTVTSTDPPTSPAQSSPVQRPLQSSVLFLPVLTMMRPRDWGQRSPSTPSRGVSELANRLCAVQIYTGTDENARGIRGESKDRSSCQSKKSERIVFLWGQAVASCRTLPQVQGRVKLTLRPLQHSFRDRGLRRGRRQKKGLFRSSPSQVGRKEKLLFSSGSMRLSRLKRVKR